jgi:peptidyl-prolyl cis-trans isomerase A (cyclophilin A)
MIRNSLVAAAVLLSAVACEKAPPAKQAPPAESATKSEPAPVTAPASFQVRFETSKGPFVVEVHRDWAPNGVDRLYQLVQSGYYDNCRFFRVIPGFMAQFGMNGTPSVNAEWDSRTIPDDPVKQSNVRGMVTFAQTAAPNSRSTQLFINFGDNSQLDASRFAPIGRVTEGMEVVDRLYGGYGEGTPRGNGPDQGSIAAQGNAYLERDFPKLDYIRTATIVSGTAATAASGDSTKKP